MVNVEGSLSADLIAQQNFGSARRGFDPDEVRSFLAKVAAEIVVLHERQSALEDARRDAEYRAAHPSFDEDTLLGAVGDETAHILKSAHEAASDIKARAEENASRILKAAHQQAEALRGQAETVLARRTEEAEAVAGKLKETARGEAERLVDQSRQQSKAIRAQAEAERNAMIEGAQATREKILSALSRKRNVAVAQVEALRAGRERLMESYQVVRRTLDEATAELARAESEARAAADAVRHRPLALDEPDGLDDEGGPPTNPTLPIIQKRLRPAVDDPHSAPPPGRADPPAATNPRPATPPATGPRPGRPPATSVGPPQTEAAPAPARPATPAQPGPEPTSARPGPPSAPAGRPADRPASPATAAALPADRPASPAPASAPAALPAEPSLSVSAAAPSAGTSSPPNRPALLAPPTTPAPSAGPAPSEAEHRPAPGPPAPASSPAPAPASKADARTGAPGAPGAPDPAGPASAPVRPAPSGQGDGEQAPSADSGGRPEAASGPDGAAPTSSESNTVESLFARIRADRDRAVAHAREVLAEDRPVPDEDEALLQRRDEVVGTIEANLTRRLKRALQDDQNDLLDRLRGLRSSQKPAAVVLPSREAHKARFHDAGRPFLSEAVTAGVGFTAWLMPDLRPSEHLGGIEHAADELADAIVEPLRRRLESVLTAGEGDDPVILAEAVGAAYREWKAKRVELVAADHVAAAFAAGAYTTTPAGTALRWLVEDVGGPCPDCDDNVLAGELPKGEAFPTGQRHPPAHPGCRCLLIPHRG